ncbi:unnamed protein product [Peniophora sp. CBMAI 1063]|nr:unnamed protein product [Peniophora sp. CBMAI 1063]
MTLVGPIGRIGFLAATSVAVLALAPSGPWDAFNFAPESRTVAPASVRQVNGTIASADGLVSNGSATFSASSWLTLDFGIEVGGIISMSFSNASDDASVALAWTESPLYISPTQSDSSSNIVADSNSDGVLTVSAPLPSGVWTQPAPTLRGGFRFLTISLAAGSSVTISNVSLEITFMPDTDDLRAYTGYFYAQDPGQADEDLLTRVWYAGAYTAQTNIIAVTQGREQLPSTEVGWLNNGTIGLLDESPVTVDGAKRDRTVWPGDMGIAVATEFVSLDYLDPTRNSLDEMFSLQNASGAIPYCGPTISCGFQSITYHEWTLFGVFNYWLYSGDVAWVQKIWSNYTLGLQYLANKIDATTGLLDSTGQEADWGRNGGGNFSISPNVLYYKVLLNSITLANALNDSTSVDAWAANATASKAAIQSQLWMDGVGMFRDNTTTDLAPQDGNALALLYNLTISDDQKQSISKGLTAFWGATGAVTPERLDTISPFVGGFEIQAHFEAGQGERALDLIRLQWGYMMTTNLSVQSTLIEGYLINDSLEYYYSDGAYTSHAHGWSTGPTSALTFYLVGLQPTGPQGQTWQAAPQLSGLPAAQGSFETGLGTFAASWTFSNSTGFNLALSTPEGTQGTVVLPVAGSVTVDGQSQGKVTSLSLAGGEHTIAVDVSA